MRYKHLLLDIGHYVSIIIILLLWFAIFSMLSENIENVDFQDFHLKEDNSSTNYLIGIYLFFMISIPVLAILLFLNHSIFKYMIWKSINNKKPSKKGFGKFLLLNLTAFIWIIPIIILALNVVRSPVPSRYIILYSVFYLSFFINANTYNEFAKKENIIKAIINGYKNIFTKKLNVGIYALGVLVTLLPLLKSRHISFYIYPVILYIILSYFIRELISENYKA